MAAVQLLIGLILAFPFIAAALWVVLIAHATASAAADAVKERRR